MSAKTRRLGNVFLPAEINERELAIVQERLGKVGLSVDAYDNHLGFGDWESRIAVTGINGQRVNPSSTYAHALEMRAIRATREAKEHRPKVDLGATVRVEQTAKYARRVGDREYVTTDEPHGVVNFKRFASDEGYAEALSTKVIQCVDIMVHDRERDLILIGTRQQEPHSGDWVIGGGMRAGESVADAAHRNMYRELGFHIDDDQLTKVGDYKFVWDSRAQGSTANEDGQEINGCHMSSTLVEYPVDSTQIDLSSFNEEYSNVAWVPGQDILDAPEGRYHPCLVDMVTDLRSVR